MVRIEESASLKRPIRKDPIPEIGISTLTRLEEAISGSRKQEALDLCRYLPWEGKRLHDLLCDWPYSMMTYIADRFGEEELYKLLRFNAGLWKPLQDVIPLITVEEFVQMNLEPMSAQRS